MTFCFISRKSSRTGCHVPKAPVSERNQGGLGGRVPSEGPVPFLLERQRVSRSAGAEPTWQTAMCRRIQKHQVLLDKNGAPGR